MYVERDHVATLAQLQAPTVSAPGATLSADTAVLNDIEGAIAVLERTSGGRTGLGKRIRCQRSGELPNPV